ncbi:uncharacterized protein E0L32_008063 [Thyridium curvatum]|uniref:Uncharacterized protein n=1 Tax=Thyridium curvatum TaxID=1093900 RepID=A0A507AWB4_9PEZI|nr:uncharacterized protein E0L32_008063 [Thyridium curvatum]TPX11026.1 hypothetical protein E0L32_008063 [Thyridium curvatum]
MASPLRPPVPVIDLTGDDDTSSSSSVPAPSWPAAHHGGHTAEVAGRPAKRPRLEEHHEVAHDTKALLNRCLHEQIFPQVNTAVSNLPKEQVNTTLLTKDVLSILLQGQFFSEFRQGNGYISPDFQAQLAAQAQAEVNRLRREPKYSIQAPIAYGTPAPAISALPSTQVAPAISANQSAIAQPSRTGAPSELSSLRYQPASRLPNFSAYKYSPPASAQLHAQVEPHGFRPALADPFEYINLESDHAEVDGSVSDANTEQWEPEDDGASDEDIVRAADIDLPSETKSQEEFSSPAALATTPLRPRKIKKFHHTSPQNFRARARDLALQAEEHAQATTQQRPLVCSSRYFSLERRPYRTSPERKQISRGSKKLFKISSTSLREPGVVHVDFSEQEAEHVLGTAKRVLALGQVDAQALSEGLKKLHRENKHKEAEILSSLDRQMLKGRTDEDIRNFLRDVRRKGVARRAQLLTLERDDLDKHAQAVRTSRLSSLLLARETAGHNGFGPMRGFVNFRNEFRKCREDELELRTKWVDCAGDITTIAWTSNQSFICGTTTHSDSRNQQYNKPGNLLLGSTLHSTLQAYPDHRVVRPVIDQGENSTEAMRQSQDPWLYSSVVSSDFDQAHDRVYTSSFDKTVKIWRTETSESASSMKCLGTWKHEGNVNFVVASKHSSGMVATAADVAKEAVRIYTINEVDIENSGYHSFSCSRIVDLEGNPIFTEEKWAYFPATIQWGRAPDVQHLLLVGYSPRSMIAYEDNIPEDRRNSGEVCLWDGRNGDRWRILGGTSQNVFEVAWHPSQSSFIVASSPVGLNVEDHVHTQIRIFRPSDNKEYGEKAFSEVQVLDCPAADINELAIMPNSFTFSYVTAGCTDGKVYVWDTARGQRPIHVLSHGPLIEEFTGDREKEDTGVKFTAWGTSPDRFYTGSSDGIVKVWNVRSLKKPLVRDLLECPAPVSFGAFSPDLSKLVVGDASGRVWFLSIDADEEPLSEAAPQFAKVRLPDGSFKTMLRPNPFKPHPEPPAPTHDAQGRPLEPETGIARARAYLQRGELKVHRDPTVGAVQGGMYAQLGLYRREAHFQGDPEGPLNAGVDKDQLENIKMYASRTRHSALGSIRDIPIAEALHRRNLEIEAGMESLSIDSPPEPESEPTVLEAEDPEWEKRAADYDREPFIYEGSQEEQVLSLEPDTLGCYDDYDFTCLLKEL